MINAFKKDDLVRSDFGVGVILYRRKNNYYVMMLNLDGTMYGTVAFKAAELEIESDPSWVAAYGRLKERRFETQKAYPPKKEVLTYPSDGDFGKIAPV